MSDEIKQGSPEWLALRCGKVTASRLSDVMAKGKGGAEASTRRKYRAQIVAERLSGKPSEGFRPTAAMLRGTELEPIARAEYEIRTGLTVVQVPFVDHPTIPMFGASPDGLVGTDGLWEGKIPETQTHIDYLLDQVAPADYHLQMLGQMMCCQRAWCDFQSYDDRLPDRLKLFIVRFPIDIPRTREIECAVREFNAGVEQTIARLAQI